jgi:hypothetical protein
MEDDVSRNHLTVLKVLTLIFVLDHLKPLVDGPCLFREVQTFNLENLTFKELTVEIIIGSCTENDQAVPCW